MPEADTAFRVAIVSSQEVVARGLVAMLADYPDRLVVTAMPGTRSAARGIHVIIYDSLTLRGSNEAEFLHLVEETDARVLVLGRDTRPDLRIRCMELGGTAWVPMSVRAGDLVRAVEEVAQGRSPSPIDLHLESVPGLTARETEVLSLIAQGMTNDAIAKHLFVTENTLKSHVRRLYRKIGVASRTQAVLWAIGQGLVPDIGAGANAHP